MLEARHGVVQVGKYLEGDISLAAAAVHARMIKGHSIKVRRAPHAHAPIAENAPTSRSRRVDPVWKPARLGVGGR